MALFHLNYGLKTLPIHEDYIQTYIGNSRRIPNEPFVPFKQVQTFKSHCCAKGSQIDGSAFRRAFNITHTHKHSNARVRGGSREDERGGSKSGKCLRNRVQLQRERQYDNIKYVYTIICINSIDYTQYDDDDYNKPEFAE